MAIMHEHREIGEFRQRPQLFVSAAMGDQDRIVL
jgi:hypothetical protein